MGYQKKNIKTMSWDEFVSKTTPCPNGRWCNKEGCTFKHDLKTKMCKYEQRCKNINNCKFAHDESELFVPLCRFGEKCKNNNCTFKHPEIKKILIEKEQKPLQSRENLKKNNFPDTIPVSEEELTKKNINYNEMRDLISEVDTITLKGSNVEELIDQFKNVLSFKEIIFEL